MPCPNEKEKAISGMRLPSIKKYLLEHTYSIFYRSTNLDCFVERAQLVPIQHSEKIRKADKGSQLLMQILSLFLIRCT